MAMESGEVHGEMMPKPALKEETMCVSAQSTAQQNEVSMPIDTIRILTDDGFGAQ